MKLNDIELKIMELSKNEKDALYAELVSDLKARYPDYHIECKKNRYNPVSRIAEVSWLIRSYKTVDPIEKIYRYQLSKCSLKWIYIDSQN